MSWKTVYPSTSLYPSPTLYPFELSYEILVFDRTAADVEYRNQLKAKMIDGTATQAEKDEWNMATLKGTYNHNDLNRVGAILEMVQEIGTERGFSIVYPHQTVTSYTTSSLPTEENIEDLIDNVEVIKTMFALWIPTLLPEHIRTINDANAIEDILYQTKRIFEGTEMANRYSNELYSGGTY